MTIGKNIKQLPTRTTPLATDFMYIVAGDSDFNVTLQALAALFGTSQNWVAKTIASGTTGYIPLLEAVSYGACYVHYLIKRADRTFHAGVVKVTYSGDAVATNDIWDNLDSDDLGVSFSGQISSGYIQLNVTADASDVENTIMNYLISFSKPLTV